MSKHTSGPWTVHQDEVSIWPLTSSHKAEPDARVRSAAPGLLAVATFLLSIEEDVRRKLCQCDKTYCAVCMWLNDAQRAVQKALGNEQGAQEHHASAGGMP